MAGDRYRAAGVIHSYDPIVVGSVLAAGIGAAAVGAGGASAQDSSGRRVSATAVAAERITSWAVRDSRRYARLPHSILAVVTDEHVSLSRWSPVASVGAPILWPRGSFTATRLRHRFGAIELRIGLRDGKVAVLSALSGPQHRGGRRVIDAIADLGRAADAGDG